MFSHLHKNHSYILAVDDNPDNLHLLKLTLEPQGYKLILVNNGYDALQEINKQPPSLILLDVMMPDMDGYEVTRRIRSQRNLPFIPILLITAHQHSSVVKGLDSGADEFIRKPYEIDELQARVRSLIRLKNSIDQRASFVSCLTHDLRTPIIAANRMLSLIKQQVFGQVTTETDEAVTEIIKNNDNLLEMLNTLLDTYQYEIGQKVLNFEHVDLRDLILTVIKQLLPLATEKKLEIQLNSSHQLPQITGDKLELRRLFTNLIANAIKYTDYGFIEVNLNDSADKILIQIKDTGVGISPDDLKLIFERYYQSKNRRSGKGIGLYLCKQIIETHNGEITVQSELGKGTIMTITLPVSNPGPYTI